MENVHYYLLAILRIAVGLPICFVGYRHFRFSLISTALVAGGFYVAALMSVLLDGYVSEWGWTYWLTLVIGGSLCSIAASLHTKSSVCIAGFCAGYQLVTLVTSMLSYTGPSELLVVGMAVAGVIDRALTIWLKRPALVVATSFVGASLLITGASFLVDRIAERNAYQGRVDYDAIFWTTRVILLVLFAIGTWVQFHVTGGTSTTKPRRMPVTTLKSSVALLWRRRPRRKSALLAIQPLASKATFTTFSPRRPQAVGQASLAGDKYCVVPSFMNPIF